MLFEKEIDHKKYKIHYSRQAVYIQMRDGIKIAVDVHFGNIQGKLKYSTILMQTRYWRRSTLRKPFGFLEKKIMKNIYKYLKVGFIVVFVDVRGTGASFGCRPYPWSEKEVADMYDIADWIVNQPWSDGNIITSGVSYTGTTSELSSSIEHPGYKGHVFAHNEYDPYIDIAYPGGVFNEGFIKSWSKANENLDNNTLKDLESPLLLKIIVKSVAPVDEDFSSEMLKLAVKDHQSNMNVYDASSNASFRDDLFNFDQKTTFETLSVYRYTEQICKVNRPLFCLGSWFDGGTANSVINRFLNYTNPMIVLIGSWDHHFETNGDPLLSKSQTRPSSNKIRSEFIQFWKESCNNIPFKSRYIQYLTVGENIWKTTESFPPKGFEKMLLYFAENNQLLTKKPNNTKGNDLYKINYTATTGTINRWTTEMAGPVIYKNRAKEDKKLLTFTSFPLDNDVEITGYPEVSLSLSSSHDDGAIFVYLEHISPEGYVYYITEGQLRLICHKTTNNPLPYKTLVIPHSFTEKEKEMLTPGEIYKVEFSLNPISILIPKGNRLRIAIAGTDKGNFKQYPESGNPELTIYRNKIYTSGVNIPMKNR